MRTRPLTLFGSCLLVSTTAFAMVACAGGETDDGDATGGVAGTAGTAGLAGTAGAGNASGAGGMAGSSATGGAGNTGGVAGSAAGTGNTGNTAGNGGVGNMSGSAGSGNTSGDGGTGNTGNSGGFGNDSGNGGVGNTGNTGGVGNQGGMGNTGNAAGSGNTGNTAGQDPGPSVTPGQCDGDLGGYQNGSVTFYTFSMGTTLVNCSYGTHQGNPDRVDFVTTGDGQYFAAINTSDYDNAATCGACIEVTRDGNRKVTVTVVDQCPIGTNPKCTAGHLDLSKAAFLQLGNESEGYLGNGGTGQISWKYVPCQTEGNVHFRLKEPSNANWNQLLVENHKYQITKVEVRVNGNWVNATRQDYNFWEPPNGTFGTPPYRVRVTDVNGTVLEDTVDLTGGDQEAENQMTCQ